jgi:MraZ protein
VSGYFGQYEYGLDEKGRVSLPPAFRKGDGAAPFVLLKSEKDFLHLYPQETWQDVLGRMLEFRKKGPKQQAYVRHLIANAVEVNPDKQWRILIPARLQAGAALEIQKPVLLVGNITWVELWNPEVYSSQDLRADDPELEDFKFELLGH